MFYAHYKVSGSLPKEQFNQFDLRELKMKGNDISFFHRRWKMMVFAMEEKERNKITNETLLYYYHKQVAEHKLIEFDMRIWDMWPNNHPEKSYHYLLNLVELRLDQQRQKAITKQREQGGIGNITNPYAHTKKQAAMAAKGITPKKALRETAYNVCQNYYIYMYV